MMVSIFDELKSDVEKGIEGKSISIPIGLEKLGKYAAIKQKMFSLIFSSTGAGKSSLADTCYILNPYEWLISKENVNGIEMDTILFSMERAKKYRISKFVIRKIFNDHGVMIPLPKLFGWWQTKMTKEEHDLFLMYEDYITGLEKMVNIYEGPKSPSEIEKILKSYFLANGKYEKIDDDKQIYIPHNPNKIVNIIIDHGNITKVTSKDGNKKAAIDHLCEIVQSARDLESAHIVWIAQVNRSASDSMRQKNLDDEITLDDIKASGDIADACDIGLALIDPLVYKQVSKTGYNAQDFVNKKDGSKCFRSLTIVKSTYGSSSVRIPLAFNGATGDFKEMQTRKDVNDTDYKHLVDNVVSGTYFFSK